MLPLMLFRPILHLKPAPTGPSPRVSLIMAYTVSGYLLPLLSLLLCPHQHPHSRDPVKGRHHREAGAHLTCENHFSGKRFDHVSYSNIYRQYLFFFACLPGMSGDLLIERLTHGNTEQSRGVFLTMSQGNHLF